MAVAVGAGIKRGLFDDDPVFGSPSPSKRVRGVSVASVVGGSGPSPLRAAAGAPFNPFSASPDHNLVQLAQLCALFPDMDPQIVAETLENAEHNLEAAIRCLEGLRLSAASRRAGGAGTEQSADSRASHDNAEASSSAAGGGGAPEAAGGSAGDDGGGVRMAPERLSAWAGQLVQEMQGAADLAQAHARAGHLLQQFEGDITTKVVAAAAAENASLQNHVQALARDNTILKRAVAVQNQRRQEEHASHETEKSSLQQTVLQYEERLRTAEMNNYALSMHLRQAASASGSLGRNPDVC